MEVPVTGGAMRVQHWRAEFACKSIIMCYYAVQTSTLSLKSAGSTFLIMRLYY